MRLELEHLSKKYKNVQALKDVSFVLENGVYGLLGPNGAGKSTMIGLITDTVRRDQGRILWNGKEILELGKSFRRELGYMPQQQGYYEEFTARDFLIYMAKLKGLSGKRAKQKADEMLEIVNMEEYFKEKMGTFSGGMKQRILLAQALLNDPNLLILDEPTAGVDPQERIRIRNFISRIAEDRIIILATHIVSDIEAIAKEIVLLRKGEIVQKGTPAKMMSDIKSYVYEKEIKQEERATIENEYTVSQLKQTERGYYVKIISENRPKDFEQAKYINLEDVYLFYFDDKAMKN